MSFENDIKTIDGDISYNNKVAKELERKVNDFHAQGNTDDEATARDVLKELENKNSDLEDQKIELQRKIQGREELKGISKREQVEKEEERQREMESDELKDEEQRLRNKQLQQNISRGRMSSISEARRATSGLGTLILYGGIAYVAYTVYKGSSFSGTSVKSTSWQPMSLNEISNIQKLTS
jgi:DNA repair exonuclease SbcCD ATPase subunit